MEHEEMISVLKITNDKRKNPVPEKVLQTVMALVIKNPLEKDRLKCQEQIQHVLFQMSGGEEHDD